MIIGWSGLFSALAELENENGVHFLALTVLLKDYGFIVFI